MWWPAWPPTRSAYRFGVFSRVIFGWGFGLNIKVLKLTECPRSQHEFGDVAYRLRVGYQRVVVGTVELNPTCGDRIQHLFARIGVQRTLQKDMHRGLQSLPAAAPIAFVGLDLVEEVH
ncbi:hypothetical protein EYZ11_009261 [Aspergillus tanneri]|uniref:Uncharacterized protein n=1 Tax=Aspergillus tanneri TaxID=1220188 RepID=A0A4V3UNH6_9EURO|nr:hypothetical protein EYZ11_009261 [Aspergillus tanneri]